MTATVEAGAIAPHSARQLALLYSPPPQYRALEALSGIEREILESLRPDLDHHVAHSRLQWWREECERTSAGKPVHPLTRALVDVLPVVQGLSGLVDAAVWDLAKATFETRRELTAYCERWGAAMFETMGGDSTWRLIGASIREIELLADVAREAHHGRIRLPLDELSRIKVDPSLLAKTPWPSTVAEILRVRHRALRDEITRGLANVDRDGQGAVRGLIVWAALACRVSQRAERGLPNRLQPRRLDAISDAWFAWHVARKANAGRFRPS